MADIKFRCPDCAQKIVVDSSAAGLAVDCPYCQSKLEIPRESGANARLISAPKARLAVQAGAVTPPVGWEQKQAELEAAVVESKALREAADKARGEAEAVKSERDRFRADSERLIPSFYIKQTPDFSAKRLVERGTSLDR